MAKKKRDESEAESQAHLDNNAERNKKPESEVEFVNGDSHEKINKKKKKKKGEREQNNTELNEKPTVTIALPGSIIHNAQSLDLATRLAGQIARAVTIFRIDEVVVFDNKSTSYDDSSFTLGDSSDENETGSAFLIRILRYLETPQYLRKNLFAKHNSLRFVGLLPPLDAPHHLRKHEWGPYREGVALKEPASNCGGTLVDVGLNKNVVIDQVLEPGTRVTVAMGTNRQLDDQPRQVISSSKPREEAGMYWGYKVRYAANISSVFNFCPYKGGYDHLIGTSEHGVFIKSSKLILPPFRHLLIAFGGLAGLEECFEEDNSLKGKSPSEVFHSYLNVCPNQGSRTIRTENMRYQVGHILNLIQRTARAKDLIARVAISAENDVGRRLFIPSELQWIKAVENGEELFKHSGKRKKREHLPTTSNYLTYNNAEGEHEVVELKSKSRVYAK